MATTYQTIRDINGPDYGIRGSAYLRRLRLRPGALTSSARGRPGQTADIWLEFPSGASYSFIPKQEVKIYYVNAATGNMAGRYLGGFIKTRATGKVSGGTNRVVHLVVSTYDVELDYLVSGAAGYVTLASGTISAQI